MVTSKDRGFARLGGMLVAVLACVSLVAQGLRPEEHWVGSWATAVMERAVPQETPAGPQAPALAAAPVNFNHQTLRQIVHVSLGGDRLRVVFSNAYGTTPLEIGAAHVALRDQAAAIKAQSARELRFGGRPTASIPPGALFISDPVSLTVPAAADLVVDTYLPGNTDNQPVTVHAASWQTGYVSETGNFSGSPRFTVKETTDFMRGALPSASWFFLSRVEVAVPQQAGAVVTLGDSITDGTQSGNNANNRWPDQLARRFAAANIQMGVLNVGIGGNRVLSDGNGISALARFDRDVLAQTGATHVIFFEGINDIQGNVAKPPSAEDLIAAHQQIIERAHSRGLKIFGATLTPFGGANGYNPEREARRQQLNQWIRTGKMYDGVIDFEAAVKDPTAQPMKIRADFDPGDHLHLNAVGYKAMADIIDLDLFGSTRRPR